MQTLLQNLLSLFSVVNPTALKMAGTIVWLDSVVTPRDRHVEVSPVNSASISLSGSLTSLHDDY